MKDVTELPQRFLDKIHFSASTGCWLWTAPLRKGYGKAWYEGASYRSHRLIYELLEGPIPAGLDLDHLCRVRHCVRPDHMEAKTRKENLHSPGSLHGALKTHCPQGHEYSVENTYVNRNGSGGLSRACKICVRARDNASRAKIKANQLGGKKWQAS